MKRISGPLEGSSLKYLKPQVLYPELFSEIASRVFKLCGFDVTNLRCVCKGFKLAIDSDSKLRWVLEEKMMLVAMRGIPGSFIKGDLAYAKMLIHTASKKKEAFKILPYDAVDHVKQAFRHEIIEKKLASGAFEEALYHCREEDAILSFKIRYIKSKAEGRGQNFLVSFIKTVIVFGEWEDEGLRDYWKMVIKLDPKAAFTVFEMAANENARMLLPKKLPSGLIAQNWKKSYTFCQKLSSEKAYFRELADHLTIENYIPLLEEIGITPCTFTLLANQHIENQHQFYKLASLFAKTCRKENVIAVANDILKQFDVMKESAIWRSCYLYASVHEEGSDDLYKFAQNILDQYGMMLIPVHLAFFAALKNLINQQGNLKELYDSNSFDGVNASFPYLMKLKDHPPSQVLPYLQLFCEGVSRKEISKEALTPLLKELTSNPSPHLYQHELLYFVSFLDIHLAFQWLENHSNETEDFDHFFGVLMIADFYMKHQTLDKDLVRKMGNFLIESEVLSSGLSRFFKADELRSRILTIFKWCDQHLPDASLSTKYIEKIKSEAKATKSQSLYYWLAEAARQFQKN